MANGTYRNNMPGRIMPVVLVILLVASLFGNIGGGLETGIAKAEAEAQEYKVISAQESFVAKTPASGTPDTGSLPYGGDNNGNKTAYLFVKDADSAGRIRQAYIQFDLSGLPETISSAVLYLWGKNAESGSNAHLTVTTSVYGVEDDNWSEDTLTWNNKPDIGGNRLGSLTFPAYSSSESWESLDVTSFIQSQLTDDRTATFALAGGAALIRIESRTTWKRDASGGLPAPYLVITGTPALSEVSLTAAKPVLGVGDTTSLSVAGVMDTGTAADLTGAVMHYSSDSSHLVIDDPSVGVARAVSAGIAQITVSVTLNGVTRTSTIPVTVDATPPAEVSNIQGGLINGDYTLTWTDPADLDYESVSVYLQGQLIGSAVKGVEALAIPGLAGGISYEAVFRTRDTAGNVSPGTPYVFTYEAPNVLKEVTIAASKQVLRPGESVSFTVSGVMTDGTTAELAAAAADYSSSNGSIAFADSSIGLAAGLYAGSARIRATVTLDGVTRETEPVLVRVFPEAADAYDELRIRYSIKFTGYDPDDPYDVDDPDIRTYIQAQDGNVANYWSSLDKTTYTWPDLTSTTVSSQLTTITSRLRVMSRQWASYGSVYYQDEALAHDIIEALHVFYLDRYNENKTLYDNWYNWEIGVPTNIGESLIAIYDAIPSSSHPDLITKLNRAIDRFVPAVTRTAANRVYISKVVMLRGITGKDGAKLQAGSDGLNQVFPYVQESDGFYKDGSFIQHVYFPYAGGYGTALLHNISEALWLVSGSQWDNHDPQKINVFNWYFEAFQPNMFQGQLIDAVNGREISRTNVYSGHDVVRALLLQLELTGNPYVEQQKSSIKFHLEAESLDAFVKRSTVWNVKKVKDLMAETGIPSSREPQGNFLFYNQDNVVHRGDGWLYSISMHSERMGNYESINNENLKGWYQADGMTQLYLDPMDYLSLFWITADTHRLPGITVDRDESRPPATAANRPYVDISMWQGDGELMGTSWTGGVSLDQLYGTAGMDFQQHHYSDMDVSARKSWFMFDDEIVALGAGINSTSGRTIETIVDNRKLNSQGSNLLTVDGVVNEAAFGQQSQLDGADWIHLEETGGYVFPQGSTLQLLREERAGKSQDINQSYYYTGNDEFNSTTRSSFWSFIQEDSARYSFTGSRLNIVTQTGTLLGSANNLKNVLHAAAPPEDFYITTSLDFSPTQQGQEAGLIIRMNDDNYVSVSKGVTSQGSIGIIAVNEVNGNAQVQEFPLAIAGDIFLKIDKSGHQYAVYASSNEADWGEALYTFTNPMTGTDRLNSGLRMGLFAGNGTASAPEITASFDYFHILHTRNYMTLWVDHGVQPEDAEYSYIQLPLKTSTEVAAYSANPDVAILANTKYVQAVRETTLGITGINFWERGALEDVKAHQPSSVMIKETEGQLQLAVSDPTQKQEKISFEIKRTGTEVISQDDTVTVLQLSPTIKFAVDAAADPGKTHNVSFAYDPAGAPEFSTAVLEAAQFDTGFAVVQAGSTAAPVLTAIMDDNEPADLSQATVVYYSGNDLAAAVDDAGTITGVAPGVADIGAVVTLNGISKLALLTVLVPSDAPVATALNPRQDTYVRSGSYDNDVYGSSTKLEVKKNSGNDDYREAYFSFDLSGITGEIQSVKFYATGRVEDSSGTFVDTVLKQVEGAWNEGTTYASKPELGAAISETVRFSNVDSQRVFDITDYSKAQLEHSSTLDFALVQDIPVGRKMYVYSRENGSSQPYIEVITHNIESIAADSAIDPIAADFDKNPEAAGFQNIEVTVSFNGNHLVAIKNGEAELLEGADYTVLGNRISIAKQYLAAQAEGTLKLSFAFSAGRDAELEIGIVDTGSPGNGSSDGNKGPAIIVWPSQPQPEQDASGVKVTVAATEEVREDGAGYARVVIPAQLLDKAVDMVKDRERQTITISTDSVQSELRAELPGSAWINAARNAPQAVISIGGSTLRYDLPVAAVDLEALAEALEADINEMQLVISMGEADGEKRREMEAAAHEAGLKLAGAPVWFRISVEADGAATEIPDAGRAFGTRTMAVDKSLNLSQTVVLALDPVSGELGFVPAVFRVADDQPAAIIKQNGSSIYAVAEVSKTFADMSGHWAQASVERMASLLIVKGAEEDAFKPDQMITRAEFAALLARGLGLSVEERAPGFHDVNGGDWFAGPVGAAVKAGLVEGFEDGSFRPNETITREQMTVMILRAMASAGGKDYADLAQTGILSRFVDAGAISGWARALVAAAVQESLVQGVSDSAFAPAAPASRAEAAVMLQRLLQKLEFIN